jgi:N-acetylmuramoyl-L-alanine amidase
MRAALALLGTILLASTAAASDLGSRPAPAATSKPAVVNRRPLRPALAAVLLDGHPSNDVARHSAKPAAMRPPAPTVANPLLPLQGWTIVVDPGHGRDPRYGNYTGAMGVNGISEDQNVLDIGQDFVADLRAQGATVYITRGVNDPAPPPVEGLIQRVALAEAVHADLFVSIHENDGTVTDLGVQTWYYWPNALPLAEAVQQAMVAGTGLADAGIHQKGFYVVFHTTMPAVLVEGGFLSNPSEAALISTTAFHVKEATALDAAILTYARSYPKH